MKTVGSYIISEDPYNTSSRELRNCVYINPIILMSKSMPYRGYFTRKHLCDSTPPSLTEDRTDFHPHNKVSNTHIPTYKYKYASVHTHTQGAGGHRERSGDNCLYYRHLVAKMTLNKIEF